MKKLQMFISRVHILRLPLALLLISFLISLLTLTSAVVSKAEYDECLGVTKEDKIESNKLTQKAIDYTNMGQYDEAIDCGTTALDLDPCNRFALAIRGTAYVKKGIKTKNTYLKKQYIAYGKSDLETSCKMRFEDSCEFLEEIIRKGY
jgi:tetratricopeptide (TPR) repeat protein